MNIKAMMAEALGLCCPTHDSDKNEQLGKNVRMYFYFGYHEFYVYASTSKEAWEKAAEKVIDKLHSLVQESM